MNVKKLAQAMAGAAAMALGMGLLGGLIPPGTMNPQLPPRPYEPEPLTYADVAGEYAVRAVAARLSLTERNVASPQPKIKVEKVVFLGEDWSANVTCEYDGITMENIDGPDTDYIRWFRVDYTSSDSHMTTVETDEDFN